VLGPDGGRKAMLGRLGPEAGDAMDEFLRLALDHERTGLPGLAGFLAELDGVELTVKRDLNTSRDEVRVMTVHGAKGLEAPVVILADTCAAPNGRHDPALLMLDVAEGGQTLQVPVWATRKGDDPQPVAARRQTHRDEAQEEYNRLLYVAMTRAGDRLYVTGFHGTREPSATSWYMMIKAALAPSLVEEPADDGVGTVLRRRSGVAVTDDEARSDGSSEAELPAWLKTPAPAETPRRPPLRPSGAATAADADDAVLDRAGTPDSATVDTSGNWAWRSRLVTARARSLPAFTRAWAAGITLKLKSTMPPATSFREGAVPL
jgi:ATP-dependent helicase/nuclease subunit A